MDRFEKLNEFVEGNLDIAEEQSLFSELASDDDLRTEFKQLMAISSTIKNNKNTLKKNDDTKKAVFAAIGLSLPVADAVSTTTGAAVGTAAGTATGIGIKTTIITGLLSAITAAVIVFFTFGFNAKENNNAPNPFSVPVVQKYSFDQEVPKYKSPNLNSESRGQFSEKQSPKNYLNTMDNKQKKMDVHQFDKKNNEDVNTSKKFEDNNDNKNLFELNRKTDLITNDDSEILSLNQNNTDRNIYTPVNTELSIIPDLNRSNDIVEEGWSLEWRGAESFNNNTGMQPQGDTKFINNVISVMYNTRTNWSFGAELRREAFFLDFEGTNFSGVNYRYEQMPTYNTLSILTRYRLNLEGDFDPFAQLSFGGNKIGIVGRSTVGVMYSPFEKLSLVLAGEYSNLFYQYQGDRFNSGRFGLTYGVQVNF